MLRLVAPIFTIGLVLAWIAGFKPARDETVATSSDCDRARLGTVLVLDTASLTKTQWSGPSSQSTEGALVETWSDSTGPRIVHASYFGETGRTNLSFYILARRYFVVASENVLYENPLSIEPQPRVRSRVPDVIYICDGQVDQRGDSALAANAEVELNSLLAHRLTR
jgi:hypothetical protein